jgi:hypothetical protein
MLQKGTTRKIVLSVLERAFSLFDGGGSNEKEVQMGLLDLLLIVLVIAAVAGGIGVSPLLWLLLVVALVVFLTRGAFGYGRGGGI